MSDRPAPSDRSTSPISGRLDSWKEIAAYLRRDIRTVQRWEREAGLPVHRHLHHKQGSVYALPSELDAWWQTRSSGPEPLGPHARRSIPFKPITVAALVVLVAIVTWLALGSPRSAQVATPAVPTFQKLTLSGGVALAPSLSPDGKWFVYDAYTKYRDGEQVYLQAVGGLNPVCLTCDLPGRAMEPVFSPDGDRIAFAASESGSTGLYVMARDGSSPRRLTSNGHHPTWSPDGRTIAYSTGWTHWLPVDGPFGPSELWTVDVDSGDARMVFGGDARDPSWSPDGEWIAFAAAPRDADTRDIFMIPAAGGRPTRITGHEADDWYPTWSADGSELYFVSDRSGSRGLWRVRLDRRSGAPPGPADVIAVPTAFVTFPRAGPGGALVYSDAKAPRNLAILPFDPVSGTFAGALSPVTTGTNYWRRPHLSPDGEWLVAELAATTPGSGIFTARRDGTGLRRLTQAGARDRAPRISPDGRRIVFESDRSGSWGIWIIDADGSNLRAVASGGGTRRRTLPRWSPDGRHVAAWDQAAGELVLLPMDGSSQKPSTLLRLSKEHAERLVWYEWAADGRHLALDLRDTVAVYSFDTASYWTMASPIGSGLITGWLPDGARLLMSDYVHRTLVVLDIRTWRTTEVPYPASIEGEATFSVSADGRTLAFTHGTSTADVWMMRLPER